MNSDEAWDRARLEYLWGLAHQHDFGPEVLGDPEHWRENGWDDLEENEFGIPLGMLRYVDDNMKRKATGGYSDADRESAW